VSVWVIFLVVMSPVVASFVMLAWASRKLRMGRECHWAASLAFGEAACKELLAQAKLERADALCKYAAKSLQLGREHEERARELLDGRGGF
jgi:hypothetical protein